MKSRAKQLMEFIENSSMIVCSNEKTRQGKKYIRWRWSMGDPEGRLNQFLEKQSDPRLKDAKNEVESLRMELRETRKTLAKANEDFDQLQWDV